MSLLVSCRDPTPQDLLVAFQGSDDERLGSVDGSLQEPIIPTPLPPDRTLALLQLTDSQLEVEADDCVQFARRKRSNRPPKKGRIVEMGTFPPEGPTIERPEISESDLDPGEELRVIRVMPEGEDLDIVPQIVVTFSEPMIPLSSIAQVESIPVPVQVLPPTIQGDWEWIGTNAVKLKASHRVPQATEFEVRIPSGTRSELGHELPEDIVFRFSTRPVTLVSHYPEINECVSGDSAVLFMEFDQRVDSQHVCEMLQVGLEDRRFAVRNLSVEEVVELIEGDDHRMKKKRPLLFNGYERCLKRHGLKPEYSLFFTFVESLPLGSTFDLTLPSGVRSAEGPRMTSVDQVVQFRTYGAMILRSRVPKSGERVMPLRSWTFQFSNPIELEGFDASAVLSVDPPLENLSVDPVDRSLCIRGKAKGNSAYTVTFRPELTDVYGQSLTSLSEGPIKEEILVGPPRQTLQIFHNGSMVVHDITMSGDDPEFSIVSINLAHVRVALFQVEPYEYHGVIGADRRARLSEIREQHRAEEGYQMTMQEFVGVADASACVYDQVIELANEEDELVETHFHLRQFLQHSEEVYGNLVVYVEPGAEEEWTESPFARRPRLHAWIQVTATAVDACGAIGRDLYMFATNLADGAAVRECSFTWYPLCGKDATPEEYRAACVRCYPDEDGMGFLSNFRTASGIVACERGNDVCFVPNVSTLAKQEERILCYVVNDRKIYRPNETITMKGIFRKLCFDRSRKFLEFLASERLDWIAVDSLGARFKSGQVLLNEHGSFVMSFQLPDGTNLGACRITFSFRGRRLHTHTFKCAEFRTPAFSTSLKVPDGPFVANGVAVISGTAELYSGGGLSDVEAVWQITSRSSSFSPPGWTFKRFHFQNTFVPIKEEEEFPGCVCVQHRGQTDPDGQHRLSVAFKPDPTKDLCVPTSITARVRIRDGAYEEHASSSSFLVHPSSVYVGIRMSGSFCRRGDPFPVDCVVTDLEGNCVEGIPVQIEVIRRQCDFRGFECIREDTTVAKIDVESESEPKQFTLKLEESGRHFLVARVRDSENRTNAASVSLYVGGGSSPASQRKSPRAGNRVEMEQVQLIADANEYTVGDEARILVTSPFDPPSDGVMFVHCNGFAQKSRFSLVDNSSTVLRVPIREHFVPNCRVRVVINGRNDRLDERTGRPSADAPPRPAYASGDLVLDISPNRMKLNVDVRPDRAVMSPGESGIVRVEVSSDQPDFVAENTLVSMIVVDEAVLSLTGYDIPDPLATFNTRNSGEDHMSYFRSSLYVKRWESVEVRDASEPVRGECGGQIFVKTLTGKTLSFEVDANDLIEDVKRMIQRKEYIPFDQQRLVHNGKELENGRTIWECDIQAGAIVHLVIRMCGGCFLRNTLVTLVEEGEEVKKPIQEIQVGDIILSYNEETGEFESKPVERIDRRTVLYAALVEIELSSGVTITCTRTHPFLTSVGWASYQEREDEWCRFRITTDSLLLNARKEETTIVSIREKTGSDEVVVFNLMIGENHTYLAEDMIVHNASDPGPAPFQIRVREDFNPLAAFVSDAETDETGVALMDFKLPDNLTRYRIWIIATNDTSFFGLAESSVKAQLPISIRPSFPRFLNFGDSVGLCTVIQNQTEADISVDVALQMTNLRLMDPNMVGMNVQLPVNRRALVRFPVKTDRAGKARVQVVANVRGMNFSDAVKTTFPVHTPCTTEAFACYGEVDGDAVVLQPILPPGDVCNEFGSLLISTSSTAVQSLTDAFLYLLKYKFDCAEQRASRVLSICAVQDVLQAFNHPSMPSTFEMAGVVASGLVKLDRLLRHDGSIGFWGSTGNVNVYLSLHVAHTVVRALERLYPVPPNMLPRCRSFVENVEVFLQRDGCRWYSDRTKASLRSFALYIRTLMMNLETPSPRRRRQQRGRRTFATSGTGGTRERRRRRRRFGTNLMGSPGSRTSAATTTSHQATRMKESAERLDAELGEHLTLEGKAWLIYCLFKCAGSRHPLTRRYMAEIMRSVNETAETANFVTDYGDDGKLVMLHSNRRTDAIILEMLISVHRKSRLIPKLVKGLLAGKKKGRWRSTQENVYVLLALKKYFVTYENLVPDFVARVWLGQDYAGEVEFHGRAVETKAIRIPMKAIVPDDDVVETEKKDLLVMKRGQGRLYYRLGLDYAPKSLSLDPLDRGFQVMRTYEGVRDPQHAVRDVETGVWTFKAGELIRVKLVMTNVSRRYHVALVDPIPAGCDIVDPDLLGTPPIPSAVNDKKKKSELVLAGHVGPYVFAAWRLWYPWYEHVNRRDERLECFASTLYCGAHEYEYVLTAMSIGEFNVPPARCEEMYSPEVFGRSCSEKVVIVV